MELKFQISKIETLQFAILQEKVNEHGLAMEVGFGFGVDEERRMLQSTFEYILLSDKVQSLKIEVAVIFALEESDFLEKIQHNNGWRIPKGFAIHMAMTTVSVARGILHEKTRNSPMNTYPLPTVNVLDAINEDIILKKKI